MADVNISRGSIIELANSIAHQLEASGNGRFAKGSKQRSIFADVDETKSIKQKADEYRVRNKSITQIEAYNRRLSTAGLTMDSASKLFRVSSNILNSSMSSLAEVNKNFEKVIVKSLNKQLQAQSDLTKGIVVSSLEDVLAMRKITDAAEDLSNSFSKTNLNIANESIKLLDMQTELHEQGVHAYDKLFDRMFEVINSSKSLGEKQRDLAKITKELANTQVKAAEAIDNSVAKNITGPLKKHMTSMRDSFFTFNKALATATLAATTLYSDVMEMRRTGFAGGMKGLYTTAASMGVKPKDLIEANAANRQLIMNIGSSAEWSSRLVALQKEYVGFIGDNTEAMKLAAHTMDTFARSGLTATQAFDMVSTQSKDTAEYMQRTLGTSAEMYSSSLNSMMQDSNMRAQLIGSSQAQRQEIVKGTLERMKERAQLGMTIDQMVAAEKAMRGISGLSVKERMKKAAQLRVMMGMYGIEGGAEAAAVTMKGKRASPAELESLRKSTAQLSDIMVSQGVQGGLASEAVAGTMMERFGMPELLGPNSVISTALNTGVKFQESTAKNMEQVNKTASNIATGVQGIVNMMGSNPMIQVLIAIAQAVGAIAMMVGASKMMGGIGAAGKGVGAVGKGFGKSLLKKIPGISLAAGLGFAGSRALSGDWGGAGMELASGAAGTFPGIGTAASVGIDAALLAKDATQGIEETSLSMSELTNKTQELIDINKQILSIAMAQLDQNKMTAEERDRMFNLGSRLGNSKSSFINPTG